MWFSVDNSARRHRLQRRHARADTRPRLPIIPGLFVLISYTRTVFSWRGGVIVCFYVCWWTTNTMPPPSLTHTHTYTLSHKQTNLTRPSMTKLSAGSVNYSIAKLKACVFLFSVGFYVLELCLSERRVST